MVQRLPWQRGLDIYLENPSRPHKNHGSTYYSSRWGISSFSTSLFPCIPHILYYSRLGIPQRSVDISEYDVLYGNIEIHQHLFQ